MARLAIGVIVGVFLSFFTVSLFDMWSTFSLAVSFSFFRALTTLIGANFEYDIITVIMSGTLTISGIFAAPLLSCILVGFISGAISKGLKRGVMGSFITIAINMLLWFLFSIFSGEDLMALFVGNQLLVTLSGMLGAFLGCVVGGLAGGVTSGPREEI